VIHANAVIARVFPPLPPRSGMEDPKLIVVIVVHEFDAEASELGNIGP
jgi:hypothetical protein